MSKSSKRRLAIAAIKNAADNPVTAPGTPAQLTQAAGTAAALTTQDSASPSSVLSGLSASGSDVIPSLNSDLSAIKLPSDSESAPSLNSEISDLSSPSLSSSPSPPPAAPASPRRGKTLQDILAEPPSEFFKTHLEPHCPPQDLESTLHPAMPPEPDHPFPIVAQLEDFQAKLRPAFGKTAPDAPAMDRMLHNYVIVLQIATIERLIHDLPGMSESAQVETNNQIVRMLSIIERTNSRRARELREKDAAARRIIRDQQRKERQAQKEAESIARTQRNQQREESRRQREKAKADRAAQKHELAMRKLDLKERDLFVREKEVARETQPAHHNSGSGANSNTAPSLVASA